MAVIHFLNVQDGDCSIIQHNSDRVSVLDVCNAVKLTKTVRAAESALQEQLIYKSRVQGNFNQKDYPVNPLFYMDERNISDVHRFILTHPDMDHMDGMKDFFDERVPSNFWDTDNQCEKDFETDSYGRYNPDDWYFYKKLRDSKSTDNPRRLALYSNAKGEFWNKAEEGKSGDGLHILAPTAELVAQSNECEDYNDCSYVLLYRTGKHRILFAGDSHDSTWVHILENHMDDVKDIDVLIAPHHGRDSDRDWDFLDILKPALTLFGNAKSEYLAYDEFYRRKLPIITNNQANCIILDVGTDPIQVYSTYETYAKKCSTNPFYHSVYKAYYCGNISRS